MDSKAPSSSEEACFAEQQIYQKGGHVVLQWMQRLKKTNKIPQSESDGAIARCSNLYALELSSPSPSLPSSFSSLQVVLNNPHLLEDFAKFTIEEWSVENVLFYSQVEMFKSTFQEAASLAFEKARRICKEFIMPGAPMEVNVDSETKQVIIEMIKREKLCGDMFLHAQRQVFSLMEADTFPKWQKTASFKDIMEKMDHNNRQHQLSNPKGKQGNATRGPRRCQSQENGLNLRVVV